MGFLYPFLGAALTVAGGDKLAGNKAYRGMFRELGWSKLDMQVTAAAEVAAGAMIMVPGTRRLGGAMLAATSAAVLAGEVNARKPELALPRAALLLAGLVALVAPGRTKPKVVYID